MTIWIPTAPSEWKMRMLFPKGEIGLEGGGGSNDRREAAPTSHFNLGLFGGAFAQYTRIEIWGDIFIDPQSLVGANKSGISTRPAL